MNYSIFTEQTMNKRMRELPMNLRDILNSGTAMRTVQQIARIHYLDEGRTIMLTQLVAFILLGFISLDELSLEISENLHLNYEHATALAKELKVRIFRPIKEDLENVYAPIEEGEDFEREEEGYWGKTGEQNTEYRIQDTGDENEEDLTGKINKDSPLILHEEKPLTEKRKGTEAKGFSLPMGFFKKKGVENEGEAVKVRVDDGDEEQTTDNQRLTTNDKRQTINNKQQTTNDKRFTDDGKRVVHYSELRTQLTPYEGGEELINLEMLRPQTSKASEVGEISKLSEISETNKTNKSDRLDKSNKISETATTTTTPIPTTEVAPRERTKGFWFFAENVPPKKVTNSLQPTTDNQRPITDDEIKKVDINGQAKVEGNTIDLR